MSKTVNNFSTLTTVILRVDSAIYYFMIHGSHSKSDEVTMLLLLVYHVPYNYSVPKTKLKLYFS